jgi:thiamine-phosphate pyrophosphorylase
LKRESLHGLYAITDEPLFAGRDFAACVEQALVGGARIIQYRDKSLDQAKRIQQAQALRTLCNQHQALLIINDDLELAKQVGADGVHLGSDDAEISQARAVLGAQAIIGVSCYNRFELAERAVQQNADYLAFGAFYASPTKPAAVKAELELLRQAQRFDLPLCAIGGITLDNAAALIAAGADMLAVISGIFATADISTQARRFTTLAEQTPSRA